MTPDQVWNIIYLLIIKLIKWSFSKEAFASILVLISSLATLILTNRNNNKQNEEQRKFQIQQSELQRKENFINISLENRISAYSSLFDELKKLDAYFNSFVTKDDELTNFKEVDEFAPLKQMENFKEAYSQKELWFSKGLQESVTQIFNYGRIGIDIKKDIALAEIRGEENTEEITRVEFFCIEICDKIKEANNILREDLGLTYIEEYKEKLRNVKFN
ncbi:hypothetical protein [Priestia megaterium]